MKRLLKWLFRLVLLLLVTAGAIVLLRNTIAEQLLEHRLTEFTGHDAVIGRVQIELSRPVIHLEKLRLFQPRELESRAFLDATEIHVAYDPEALRHFQVHLTSLDVRLKEIALVRKDALSTQQVLRDRMQKARAANRTLFSPLTFTGLDTLKLSLSTYKSLDYVQMVRSQDLFVDLKGRLLTNVHSAQVLEEFLRALAREKGVQWPILPDPEPVAAPGDPAPARS